MVRVGGRRNRYIRVVAVMVTVASKPIGGIYVRCEG